MRGKASGRWIDAEGKKRYHALSTAEVLRWLKLVPTLSWASFLADWERKLSDHCWTMAIFLRMLILLRCS